MRIPWQVAISIVLVVACAHAQRGDTFRAKRLAMVEQYVAREGRSARSRCWSRCGLTPRHEFVPRDERRLAYFDMALPIGHGQTISPPYVVAFMTEALDPQPDDRVLGDRHRQRLSGGGVESFGARMSTRSRSSRPLGQRAAETLRRLGYANVHRRIGDGYAGLGRTCTVRQDHRDLFAREHSGGPGGATGRRWTDGDSCRANGFSKRCTASPRSISVCDGSRCRATFFVPMTGVAEQQRQVRPDLTRPELTHGSFESTQEGSDRPAGWYYVREGRVSPDEPQAPNGQHVVTFTNDIPDAVLTPCRRLAWTDDRWTNCR